MTLKCDPKKATLADLSRLLCELIDHSTPEQKDEMRRELVEFGMGKPASDSIN